MATKLPVVSGLRAGFAFAASRETWAHFLRMAWPLAALFLIGYAAYGTAAYRVLIAMATNTPTPPSGSDVIVLAISVLLLAIGSVGTLWIMAASMRLRAMQFDHTLLPKGWGRAGVCIAWWSFLVTIPICLLALAIAMPVIFLMVMMGMSTTGAQLQTDALPVPILFAAYGVMILALWGAAALFLRWYFVAVARAAGGKLSAGEAWAMGRGHGLRLAFITVISGYGLPFLLSLVLGLVLGVPPMGSTPQELRTLDPATLPGPAVNGAASFLLALTLLFSLLWVSAVWVDAYRALTAGRQPEAGPGDAAGGDGVVT